MVNIPTCKPRDPDTHRPKYRPPPGSCDAHCHIFGPGDRYPYAPDRTYTPPDAPLSRFKELQSILGLERAVLVNASCHGTDNTVIVDAIAQSGGRYRGVANADDSFTERMFEDLHQAGFRGVRFNFVKHLGGRPEMRVFHRVLERIAPLGWHLVLHLDAADIVELAPLLRGLRLPFIIDHMGRVKADAGLDQAPFRALLERRYHGETRIRVARSYEDLLRECRRSRIGSGECYIGIIRHHEPAPEEIELLPGEYDDAPAADRHSHLPPHPRPPTGPETNARLVN